MKRKLVLILTLCLILCATLFVVTACRGKDGVTPTIEISADGYWVINGVKTEYKAIADKPDKIEISADGYWVINGVKTEHKAVADNTDTTIDGTEGLAYMLNEDKKSYCVRGLGLAADFDIVIPSTYKGLPVTRIAYGAFNGGTAIRSIKIPSSITYIDEFAFNFCSAIESIEIPTSVTFIGKGAFDGCKSLKTATVPGELLSMIDIEYLETLTISGKEISDYAFADCKSLKTVIISEDVSSIGFYSFKGCSLLENITIPDSVVFIGYAAFRDTAYYKNASNWENNLLYIGKCLIEAKSQISGEYSIKQGTTLIAESAFASCDLLVGITVPESVKIVNDGAFSNCSSLTSVTIENGVTSIGHGAFEDCSSLISIEIPNSVKVIDNYAFSGCSSLDNIILPDTEKSIGFLAFQDTAYWDKQSNWDNGALYIGKHLIIAPWGRTGEYAVKEGTISIAGGAFMESQITKVFIPKSVSKCGNGVFVYSFVSSVEIDSENKNYHSKGNCIIETETNTVIAGTGKDVVIPNYVTSIGDFAFAANRIVENMEMGDGVTTIGNLAFAENLIKSLKIGKNLTTVEKDAFGGFYSLESIIVDEENVNYHGANNCLVETSTNTLILAGGESVVIPNYVKDILGSAFYSDAIKNITVNGIDKITDRMFSCCDSVTNIIIGNSVTTIEGGAFSSCESLTSIIISDSVTSISDYAFSDCDSLEKIYCKAERKPSGWSSYWNSHCSAEVIWGFSE